MYILRCMLSNNDVLVHRQFMTVLYTLYVGRERVGTRYILFLTRIVEAHFKTKLNRSILFFIFLPTSQQSKIKSFS